MNLLWIKKEVDNGYDIIIVDSGLGEFDYHSDGKVSKMLEMESELIAGYSYSLFFGVEGLSKKEILNYHFTEIIKMRYNESGEKTNGGEIRYCVPIANFLRIK